jgi:NAD(P)-dependent dehydrogenase (short-subunit alcohol dehydrogenase family)
MDISMSDLSGRVAVVTGAGRGIGAATAVLLAHVGCKVALVSRTRSELDEVASKIRQGAHEPLVAEADVSLEEDVDRIFEAVRSSLGPVDILVNNAAVLGKSVMTDMSAEDWDRVMATNLRGAFLCSQQAMRDMIPRKGGNIINVASISGVPRTEKWPGYTAYCASKGGLILFTEALSVEVRPHGIRVNAISPGSVQTRMWEESVGGEADMTPEEVARAILFLLSETSRPIQGSNLEIFG